MERFKKKTGNEVGDEETSQVSKTQPFFIIIETHMVVYSVYYTLLKIMYPFQEKKDQTTKVQFKATLCLSFSGWSGVELLNVTFYKKT